MDSFVCPSTFHSLTMRGGSSSTDQVDTSIRGTRRSRAPSRPEETRQDTMSDLGEETCFERKPKQMSGVMEPEERIQRISSSITRELEQKMSTTGNPIAQREVREEDIAVVHNLFHELELTVENATYLLGQDRVHDLVHNIQDNLCNMLDCDEAQLTSGQGYASNSRQTNSAHSPDSFDILSSQIASALLADYPQF